MAITVKPITLWRREIEHRPGALAETLAPLADSGINMQVLMAYRFPGNEERGAVELFPVSGKRATAAADASCSLTVNPDCANTWAMPLPIVPAPMTATVLIMLSAFLSGAGPHPRATCHAQRSRYARGLAITGVPRP